MFSQVHSVRNMKLLHSKILDRTHTVICYRKGKTNRITFNGIAKIDKQRVNFKLSDFVRELRLKKLLSKTISILWVQ